MRQPNLSKLTGGAFTLAGAVLTLCLSAAPAYAQFVTLEGEVFQSSSGDKVQASVSCDQGHIWLGQVTGSAVGPLPGTFVEFVDVWFNPKTGTIEKLGLKFEIYDAKGTLLSAGWKTLVAGIASCKFDPLTKLQTFSVKAALSYTANMADKTIDEGDATLEIIGTADGNQFLKPFQFTEIFQSSRWENTAGKVTGGGHHTEATGNGVTFGFNAQNTGDRMKGSGFVIDRNVGVRIKILTVEAFAQDGTWAAFTGKAEVNGILEDYRIDVDDLGEPGTGSDTFKISTDSYVSSGVLTGGNIQIHK